MTQIRSETEKKFMFGFSIICETCVVDMRMVSVVRIDKTKNFAEDTWKCPSIFYCSVSLFWIMISFNDSYTVYSILYMHFFFSRGKKRLYCSLFFNCIQSLNWIWNTPQSLILIYPLWCFARLLRWTVAQLLFYQANSDSNNRNKKQKCITNISLWKPIPES